MNYSKFYHYFRPAVSESKESAGRFVSSMPKKLKVINQRSLTCWKRKLR
ncbi:MAG: hypothetical protein LUD46_16575 [Parabacteroides sp.]|nr:hypothetical protein [Parabacteroides sp.]